MTYCRISDGPRCDVHCYQEGDGIFVLRVRTHLRPWPLPAIDSSSNQARRLSEVQRHDAELDPNNQPLPLMMPLAGETMRFQTLRALRYQLVMLRSCGYHVPEAVVANIDVEVRQAEIDAELANGPVRVSARYDAASEKCLPQLQRVA